MTDRDKRADQYAIARALARRDRTLATAVARDLLAEEPGLARRLREAADLSQQQVADALGITQASVQHYEAGRRVPESRIAASYLSLLLHVSNYLNELPEEIAAPLRQLYPPEPYSDLVRAFFKQRGGK